jgi:hypothetical protein
MLSSQHMPGYSSSEVTISAFRTCPVFYLSTGWRAMAITSFREAQAQGPQTYLVKCVDRGEVLKAKKYACNGFSALFAWGSLGDGTCSSPGGWGLQSLCSSLPKLPADYTFQQAHKQTLSISKTSSHGCLPPRHCGSMTLDSLSIDWSLFSSPQNISVSPGLLSRWHLAVALQEKGNNKISSTEASLPYYSSHYVSESHTEFKTCGEYRLIL